MQIASYALVGWSVFVLVQSLFFKFSGHEETRIIFTTIAAWMAGIGLPAAIYAPFESIGGYVIGGAELVAAGLLLLPKTRLYGALLTIGVLSGAIFFHLFTPLGVVRVVDAAGNTDNGELFAMACSVWLACALLVAMHWWDARRAATRSAD
ncbi:MAG: hypothetical protein GDA55_03595 [Cellvibrionales bacterium]|nr:hypothetical protein [Cellvibrionales bacterium]